MLEKIKKLVEEGLNYSEISEIVGIHRTTVSKICVKNDIQIKKVIHYNCQVCDKDMGDNLRNDSKCKTCVTRIRRLRLKIKSIDYLGGECIRCGYNEHLAALTFHHLEPNEKEFTIAYNRHSVSWDKLKEELDKCVILCSNCHNIEHSKYDDENLLKFI